MSIASDGNHGQQPVSVGLVQNLDIQLHNKVKQGAMSSQKPIRGKDGESMKPQMQEERVRMQAGRNANS